MLLRNKVGLSAYLAFTVCPEVHRRADQIVQSSICALVHQDTGRREQREQNDSRLYRSMKAAAGEPFQWPLIGQPQQAEDQVDDLEGGYRLDGAIEILCEEIPEDLGPEKAFK
jgi:alkanesulfonate monooxygenase SsuD/methylene tetrahydromethanopterin reductase-like flavin-dependent oxidoreductase (luciferase family)